MKNLFLYSFLCLLVFACKTEQEESTESSNTEDVSDCYFIDPEIKVTTPLQPDWSKDASMYEVNIRQHTPEGTFAAFTEDIPRIKSMGIEILWLMPINPISLEKRKEKPGDLGSYYAVADYKAVNPEFGTMEDFEALVKTAHDNDLKLIIDWVPNHTGWDHTWITEHPEWYTQNENGEIIDPLDPTTCESWGWTDVADLNYDNSDMQAAMIDAMNFWVAEKDIDGFRCDVAHNVPADFWQDCVEELHKTKDVFMLAEAEKATIAPAFDMSYGWGFHHLLKGNLEGKNTLTDFKKNIDAFDQDYGKEHYTLMFTTNHDENAWAGTMDERYGEAARAFDVLTFTIDGMPLIYSGQEAGLDKRLEFFRKDTIDWKDYPLQDFYTQLLQLKKANPALYNGTYGGELEVLNVKGDDNLYVFTREKGWNKIVVAVNLGKEDAFFEWPYAKDGSYKLEMGEILPDDSGMGLAGYGYAVWTIGEETEG